MVAPHTSSSLLALRPTLLSALTLSLSLRTPVNTPFRSYPVSLLALRPTRLSALTLSLSSHSCPILPARRPAHGNSRGEGMAAEARKQMKGMLNQLDITYRCCLEGRWEGGSDGGGNKGHMGYFLSHTGLWSAA
jgi:hypothetical protein